MGGFNNPVVGGGGDLVRERIRSPDYVPGVSGWTINQDGSAEFNETEVRGEITVTDPDGSQIHIFDEDPGDGAVIDLLPADGTPAPVAARLSTGYTTNNSGHMAPFLLLNGARYISQVDGVPFLIFLGRDASAVDGREIVLGDCDIMGLFADTFIGLNTPLVQLQTGTRIKCGSLTVATLNAGWTPFGGGFDAPSYAELPDHTGMLVGVANGTPPGAILNLPVPLRPSTIQGPFPVACSMGLHAQVVITTGGNVTVQNADPGVTWVSLAGCRWPIAGF